jgi:transposase-like protein
MSSPALNLCSGAHLLRNSFRIASKRDWDALKKDLKPIYTAATTMAAQVALDELEETWGGRYSTMIPTVAQRVGRIHAVPGL